MGKKGWGSVGGILCAPLPFHGRDLPALVAEMWVTDTSGK